jgi:putative FmdB family regulatory protein
MPIYEYQCPKCQHTFEEWVKASESHGQEPCPKCGEPSPRIMSQTSFVLKGGGWYVDDYGYRKGVTEEGAAASTGSSAATDGSAASSGSQAAEKAPAATPDSGTSAAKAAPAPSPTTGAAASAPTKAANAAS